MSVRSEEYLAMIAEALGAIHGQLERIADVLGAPPAVESDVEEGEDR